MLSIYGAYVVSEEKGIWKAEKIENCWICHVPVCLPYIGLFGGDAVTIALHPQCALALGMDIANTVLEFQDHFDMELKFAPRVHHYVYFIEAVGVNLIKIGTSTNVESRVAQLQTGSSCQLRIAAVVGGDSECEALYHSIFAECRASGEWFHATPRMREFIRRVNAPKGPGEIGCEIPPVGWGESESS